MISLYSGTPGSGKSLHIAKIIKARCWIGHPVIANFHIREDLVKQPEVFYYIDNADLDPDDLIAFSDDYFKNQGNKYVEGALLLIIDEAQLIFNVREWNMKGRERWIHFFTQHRKLGFDVIIVAQFDRMIDKQLRSLFEYEFIHRKISNFGWKGKLLSIWSGNRMFMCVQMWYPMKMKVGQETFFYSKKDGSLYDTNFLFSKPKGKEKEKASDFLPETIDDVLDFVEVNENE